MARKSGETETLPAHLSRKPAELDIIRAIATGGEDGPVLMLNMNRYRPGAGFPGEGLHRDYIAGLEKFLTTIGGKILWRHPVFGQIVGDQPLDEILAAWYPSHQAFLDLASAPGAAENYRLRAESVAHAVIHRCAGDAMPFCP
jgi:hypothetical protein